MALLATATAHASSGTPRLASASPASASARHPVFAAVVESNYKDHLVAGRLGGESRRILSLAGYGAINGIAVSPSGDRIALIDRSETDEQLAVVDIDGANFRVLTHTHGRQYWNVVWSADGQTLFFARSRVDAPSEAVWQMPADGSAAASALSDGGRAWPSDNRSGSARLALDSFRDTARYGRCAVIRTDGTHRHNVGPDDCQNPTWRPDRPVLATNHIINDTSRGITSQIWLLFTRTGRYRVVPNTQSASTIGRVYPLAWSSDGAYIYYEHFKGRGDRLHVFRIRPDGTNKKDVTPTIPNRQTVKFALQPS